MRGVRIWWPFASKSYWSTGNQWKSMFLKNGFVDVIWCEELESRLKLPQNPIGYPRINQNRVFRKSRPWLIVGCGEFQTDQDLSRNSIGRLATNENRDIERVTDYSSFAAQISNMSFISLGFWLFGEQPMGIEFWNVEWPPVTDYGEFKFDFCLMPLQIDQSRVPLHVILRGIFIKLE